MLGTGRAIDAHTQSFLVSIRACRAIGACIGRFSRDRRRILTGATILAIGQIILGDHIVVGTGRAIGTIVRCILSFDVVVFAFVAIEALVYCGLFGQGIVFAFATCSTRGASSSNTVTNGGGPTAGKAIFTRGNCFLLKLILEIYCKSIVNRKSS